MRATRGSFDSALAALDHLPRRRPRHRLQHRRQSPQRRRAGAAVRAPGRRHPRLASAAHRPARPRRRSPGASCCSRGSCSSSCRASRASRSAPSPTASWSCPATTSVTSATTRSSCARCVPTATRIGAAVEAGRFVMGIESNGAVKGCPSLPTRGYVGGNVRAASLAQNLGRRARARLHAPPHRRQSVGLLPDLPVRRGLPRRLQLHRALAARPPRQQSLLPLSRDKTLAADGVRERLVPRERAPGEPFDHGRYELVREPFDAPDPPPPRREESLARLARFTMTR